MSSSLINAPNPVQAFLGEFALAVHRFLIYPPGHPLLAEKAERAAVALGPALAGAPFLDITVTQRRLIVAGEDEADGPGHHDIAARLRDMGIGGLRIEAEVSGADIEALLTFLRLRSRSGLNTLEHGTQVEGTTRVSVRPVSLAGLEISWDDEQRGADRLPQLWMALDGIVAQGGPLPGAGHPLSDLEEAGDDVAVNRLAGGVTASARSQASSAMAVGYLRQILRTVGSSPADPYAAMVRRRLSGLIRKLDPATIRALAAGAGKPADTASFMADVGLLGDEAVAKVLKAVANPSARSLTESLARLFGKMARQSAGAEGEGRDVTQQGLRRGLLALLEEWSLENPTPQDYGAALDRISLDLQDVEGHVSAGGREPERILQMSVELDSFGPIAERAAEYMLFQADAGLRSLVALVDGVDSENAASRGISRMLSEPERILALAHAEDVDDATLTSLVGRVGDRAIDPLLDVLAEAGSRAMRHRIFEALVGFGAAAAEAALVRLPDERWYVTRNLVALVRRAGYHFPWFDPDPYLQSAEAAIRREAYLLAYVDPKRRTQALGAALSDEDGGIRDEALAELDRGVPSVIATMLSARVVDPQAPVERRAAAIRALRSSRAPVVLSALIHVSTYRSRVLRRWRLRKSTPVVAAALEVLAERWDRNPAAQAVLALAPPSEPSADDPDPELG